MPTNRWWTNREISIVRSLAAEGLSQRRAVAALAEFYGIITTPGAICGLARRNGIKFHAPPGSYGNSNRKGKKCQDWRPPNFRLSLRGVHQRKDGKFEAYIVINGKKLYLGRFATEMLAREVYEETLCVLP